MHTKVTETDELDTPVIQTEYQTRLGKQPTFVFKNDDLMLAEMQ
ncbi:hypothetical protein [Vibrio bivalvicida]|uniref:Uncharacterized protein n=1 Tax=Vibrio bivalvicida TaxID=1276888 RepID=A0ABV4MQJ0_9VIBR